MRGHCESQPHEHARGVVLYGRVDEFFKLGERHDLIELSGDFRSAHAKDGAGKKSVFAARQLLVKTGTDFEQRADASVNFRPASSWAGDAGKNFQKSGLAGAIAADEPEHFGFMDFQRHIFQGPERFVLRAPEGRAKRPCQHIAQRAVSLALPDAVAFAQAFRAYRDYAHFQLALSCLILAAIIIIMYGRILSAFNATHSSKPRGSDRRTLESSTSGRSASYEPTTLLITVTRDRLPSLPSFGRTIARPAAGVAPLPPRPATTHRATGRAPSAPTGILR